MQKRIGNCEIHGEPRKIFSVMGVCTVSFGCPVNTDVALGGGLGVHRGQFPVLGQISEFKASLLRDLAAGWSWLCESSP